MAAAHLFAHNVTPERTGPHSIVGQESVPKNGTLEMEKRGGRIIDPNPNSHHPTYLARLPTSAFSGYASSSGWFSCVQGML